ncbi:MAG: hypothetical protein AAB964_01155, partial [Patescibacteria group bacterium]
MAERDQEFLEFVVKGLVEHPEDVKITRVVDEMGVAKNRDITEGVATAAHNRLMGVRKERAASARVAATTAQVKKIQTAYSAIGITDRAER